MTGEGNDGDLLFQFYAPRYCLRQARISDGDSQNRTSSVCLRQTLCPKEKQKGQSLYLLAWRWLVSFVSVGEGTDLSDAPAKAMFRILRSARRRWWTFLLFGSRPHALRSGRSFYACKLGYLRCFPSTKCEGQSENKENPTAPGTRQCACAQRT